MKLRNVVPALLCALALGVAGCGDGGSDGGTGSAAEPAASGVSAEVQSMIDTAYRGSFRLPPGDSPDVEPGKNIWFVPLASAAVDSRTPGGIFDAAEKMGWKLTQCDGKYSPDAQVNCIRQAIADRADAVILLVIDCVNVKAALQDADKAGIPVVSAQGSDCSDTTPGAPSLFDAATHFQDTAGRPTAYLPFLSGDWARTMALALTNGTQGKGKILDVYESDLVITREQDKGIRKNLKEVCPGCEIVETVEHTGAEIGAPLQQKIEQALARHPEVNAIVNPYDAVTQISMAAVQASGRKDEIYNMGVEGEPTVLAAIKDRKGTVDAAAVLSGDWDLYAALDAVNRLLHGEKEPAEGWPTGNGTQIVDSDSENLPPAGKRFEPGLDFRGAYHKAWGLSE